VDAALDSSATGARVASDRASPRRSAGDLDAFDLHPALFDAAVSCTARGATVQLIPHTYDAVRSAYAPLEREIL
jgi:hypothetical protein